ncbi:hypothetical protein ED236_07530 [Pseudomethylobacillus aquaticus]|uniref:Integrase SAM-like N-terminal domain-containing protein n=1 Tax=Pseudomethylobacillus aquaticus TaxID=2676064 RepID=A0A3N0V0E6_9PROT|nr:hypothetical protein ED236_07530 [Pseudomethylobacillus aquaticus]
MEDTSSQSQPPKLLDQVISCLRVNHYSLRTEQTYLEWIKRYIRYHQMQHPRKLGAEHVEGFLSYLAVERTVFASAQNQAKSARFTATSADVKGGAIASAGFAGRLW